MGVSRHFAGDAISPDGKITPEAMADTELGDCTLKHCEKQASNSGMSASLSGGKTQATITINGTGNNPCAWPASCDIAWNLTIELTLVPSLNSIAWVLTGNHDQFPAHELYLMIDDLPQAIYQFMPSGSVFRLCDTVFGKEEIGLLSGLISL